MTAKMGPPSSTPPATDALNSQIVQAVQLTNAENAAYGPNQVALAPNMMITQASGLVAQSAAAYFDSASKMVLASKSVLLKDMTEKFAEQNLKGAAEDALGILITDLLMGTAAAVAAAAGAIEAESAHFSSARSTRASRNITRRWAAKANRGSQNPPGIVARPCRIYPAARLARRAMLSVARDADSHPAGRLRWPALVGNLSPPWLLYHPHQENT